MKPNEIEIWFYIKDRQQKGPIGIFELTKLFEQGVLNGDTCLWTKGAYGWQMAKSIERFKNCIASNSTPDPTQSTVSRKTETYPINRPIVRLLAKVFDLSLFTAFITIFISIFSLDLILKTSKITLFMIYLLLWVLFEPILLSIFGNTPGKALLNIKIKCVNGDFLDFKTAFKRILYSVTPGIGAGYPFMMIIHNLFSFFELRKKVRSLWDEMAGTIVLYGKVSQPRMILGICIPIAIFITGIIL